MSLDDLSRLLGRLGGDKLIEALRELRVNVDHLEYLLSTQAEFVDTHTDVRMKAVADELVKVEGLVVNMQSSCVRLPPADRVLYPRWEVPIFTACQAPLGFAEWDRPHHFFRIGFEVDASGTTWKWRLREHLFDTAIPVRP